MKIVRLICIGCHRTQRNDLWSKSRNNGRIIILSIVSNTDFNVLICEKCAYDMIMWLLYKWYGYDMIIETYVIVWYLELCDETTLVMTNVDWCTNCCLWEMMNYTAYEKWWISKAWYEVNVLYDCWCVCILCVFRHNIGCIMCLFRV